MADTHLRQVDAVLADFRRALREDLAAGVTRSLSSYQARFPGYEREIAVEHARWSAEPSGECLETTAMDVGPLRRAPGGEEASAAGDVAAVRIAKLAQQRIGSRYVVKEEIGRGGMGAVYRVYDTDLRRNLAMKVCLASGDSLGVRRHAVERTRFLEEAQVTGQLDHPGIVPVHELGVDVDDRIYFTMRLVKGQDLRRVFELVHSGHAEWTFTRALGVLLKVCEAMSYAHDKGVVHRDLKPSNIMVGKYGEVYVMDWGLARVEGRPDTRDIRVERPPEQSLSVVRTDRREALESGDDSPVITMDGAVVGTPAYMPPEQARGEIDAVDRRSDVYSLGAMLYHLLAGQVPFVPKGARMSARTILLRVLEGPPPAVHELAPHVSSELEAICDKAMHRDRARRYGDMGELAADLRAYLEQRVVQAYEAGRGAELRKWVARNKPLTAAAAAATVLLVVGLVLMVFLKLEADKGAAIARQDRANVLRLSAFETLDDLRAEADRLWPPHPLHLAAYDAWIDRANELITGLTTRGERIGLRDQLAALRERGVETTRPVPGDDPRFGEIAVLERKLAALELAQAVQEGRREPEAVDLSGEDLPDDPLWLNALALQLVEPNRQDYGREARGLALAQRALERMPAEGKGYARATLAWAQVATGRLDDALASADEALASLAPARRADLGSLASDVRRAVEQARGDQGLRRIAAVRAELDELRASTRPRRVWVFEDEDDSWRHNQLEQLVAEIEALADERSGLLAGVSETWGWGIERRREWARTVAERTVDGTEAAAAWARARASISDVDECPEYGGLTIRPQLGLLPIGRDPDSGLWEFAHPLTGAVPRRDRDGRLVLTEDVGLVFVLLPGGTFVMGAQGWDPRLPNHDPGATTVNGPPHEVELSPYFMSKYEMTQAQWKRMLAANPSLFRRDEGELEKLVRSDLHPVEQVSWRAARAMTERLGLTLPTEARWEYACRAGTSTIYACGDEVDARRHYMNVRDEAYARGIRPTTDVARWDDGFPAHAPVGSFEPNAFGLHDVHGNVWEPCLDGFSIEYYARSPRRDPFNPPRSSRLRIARGGAHDQSVVDAASALRRDLAPDLVSGNLGLRPARSLDP